MKNHILLSLICLFLASCSLLTKRGASPDTSSQRKEALDKNLKSNGVWQLLEVKNIVLQFKNIDTGVHLLVSLQEGLNSKPLPKGHWLLISFDMNGKSYHSMNISKKFVLKKMTDRNVYGGSIVVGCPTVNHTKSKLLKSMKFFNRYPFSASSGLCELVVGDQMLVVVNELKKQHKTNSLPLVIGF